MCRKAPLSSPLHSVGLHSPSARARVTTALSPVVPPPPEVLGNALRQANDKQPAVASYLDRLRTLAQVG